MEKKRVNSTKFKEFLKKNIYYFIMAICLIAVAAMIAVTVLNKAGDTTDIIDDTPVIDTPVVDDPVVDPVVDDPIDDPVDPVDDPVITPIVFGSPVATVNVIQDFTIDSLVWNSTLKHYAVHTSIAFGGADGDSVYAAYAGSVSSIEYDVLNGYTVTIKHSDTLSTTYASMNEPVVAQGQSVLKGTVLGTMGNTATNEYALGPHLAFSVYENGEVIDPYTYLSIGSK